MKILILMTLDERYVYASWGLWKNLDEDIRPKALNLLGYTDYLNSLNSYKGNWELCVAQVFMAILDEEKDDIVIGNAPITEKFDLVFNLTDGEHEESYVDKYMEILEPKLERQFNLHTAEESRMCLVNLKAAGKLISKLYKNRVNLESELQKIEQEYKEKIEKGE